MFIFDKLMPNGAQARYHKALRFTVEADGTHAVVNSYHSEEMGLISWQDTYVIPLAVKVETLADVEFLLTYANAPFEGGVIVPEETATLESLKARKLAALKLRKVLAENAGCLTPKGRVQTDGESRQKVLGLFLMATFAKQAGEPFSIMFTMEDNSEVEHDADDMIALGLAEGLYISAVHAASLVIKAAIDAVTTPEELEAIDLEVGWPAD